MSDGFGLGGGQLVNQLRMHIARPRPATDVGNTLVVDGDDGNAVRGLARGAGACKIVVTALQRRKKVGGTVQSQHRQHHKDANKPVGVPELSALT